MSKEVKDTEYKAPKKAWYKSALLPWAIIILAIYGCSMYILGWNNRSSDQAQFDAISSQISQLKSSK